MPVHDDLGIRMKTYEKIPRTRLEKKVPVAIRIDGKAFHTFTKGFQKPFDEILIKSMQETMKYLCENIQGCVLGYTQSDEITLILVDYKNENSDAWFDYQVQKCCSVAASMATMAFYKFFGESIASFIDERAYPATNRKGYELSEEDEALFHVYMKSWEKGAMFDARVFNIPVEEATNLLYWRQLDAIRNSIQMLGQANFSHKQLQGISCAMIKDMLIEEKGIDWNNLPICQQRGSCCIKESYYKDNALRNRWIIDTEIPIFKNEGREYIEQLINFE